MLFDELDFETESLLDAKTFSGLNGLPFVEKHSKKLVWVVLLLSSSDFGIGMFIVVNFLNSLISIN